MDRQNVSCSARVHCCSQLGLFHKRQCHASAAQEGTFSMANWKVPRCALEPYHLALNLPPPPSHLDTVHIGRVKSLSTQPHGHQDDDSFPLCTGIPCSPVLVLVGQLCHIPFVHCGEHQRGEFNVKPWVMLSSHPPITPPTPMPQARPAHIPHPAPFTCAVLGHIHRQIACFGTTIHSFPAGVRWRVQVTGMQLYSTLFSSQDHHHKPSVTIK